MGDVSQILGRLETAKQGDRPRRDNGKPQQEWQNVLVQGVQVGDRESTVRTVRRGALYSICFVNGEGRPAGVTAPAAALKEARADVIAAVNAAFDKVEAEEVAHQARRSERDKKQGGGNGPVEIRSTGKTERERQKKLNKNKV